MSAEKQDKIPGYYTKNEYDALYYRVNRLQELNDKLSAENTQLQEIEAKRAADHIIKASQLEDRENEIIISDPKLRSDLAFALHTKGKPRIAIKYRGSTAYEIQPKD
jgi:Holliday junction resolvase